MSPGPRIQRPTDAGFVIVGVVMFVLALTILGISLFSLSSYEAQFLGSTTHGQQATYNAASGLEMVKAVLDASPHRLDSARLVEGVIGVTYACAWQQRPGGGIDSTGIMNPDSIVTIQVVAQQSNEERRVLARFRPGERVNYYKQLFTIADSLPGHVQVNLVGGPTSSDRQRPDLRGQVWQNGTDSTWIANVDWPAHPPLQLGGVPLPDVGTFMAAHAAGAVQAVVDSGQISPGYGGSITEHVIALYGSGTRYYTGPFSPVTDLYYEVRNLTLKVEGTVVLMFPGGLKSWEQTQFQLGPSPGPNPTLVLVAPPNNYDPTGSDAGLWFFGGLNADDNLNVILVSSGRIAIENYNNGNAVADARLHRLSVFANRLFLMCPENKPQEMRYSASMDAVIDALVAQNALPSAIGPSTGGFAMIPGSWRDRWP